MAGHCLFVLFARARWADVMFVESLVLDGQAEVKHTKTSSRTKLNRQLLLVTVPAVGLDNAFWFQHWMKARECT
eukprot:5041878-Amphidinium_carterae.1